MKKVFKGQGGNIQLFNFFVDGVLVAVRAEFFQFQAGRGVAAVFHCGVTGHTCRPLIGISTTFCAFQGDDEPGSFCLCHGDCLVFPLVDIQWAGL